MSEFLYRKDNRLKNLRSDQLMEKLVEAEAAAQTQSDLDRLRSDYEADLVAASTEPMALWGRKWAISNGDLPQRALVESYFERVAQDLAALNVMNAAFREQIMRTYNMVVGDLSKVQAEAQKVDARMRLLGLSLDDEVDVDYYTNAFMNASSLQDGSTCHVERGATLKREGVDDLGSQAAVEIVDQGGLSNGLPGNKHEVRTYPKDKLASQQGVDDRSVEFVGAKEAHDKLEAVNDGSFDTWFEYEALTFDREGLDPETGEKKLILDEIFEGYGLKLNDPARTVWVAASATGKTPRLPLRLVLKLTLPQISEINWMQIVPYLPSAGIGAVLEKVETSLDGLSWAEIPRTGGDLAHLNRKLGSIVKGSEFGSSSAVSEEIIRIPSRRARFVKIFLRCDEGYATQLGHTAYFKAAGDNHFRVEGPDQGVPHAPYQPPQGVTMRFEAFPGKRYLIGLREIGIRAYRYATTSELVTKPFVARGGTRSIKRVSVIVDDEVPSDWWSGDFRTRSSFIRYFLSKDAGNTWLPITPDGNPYGPEDPPQFIELGEGEAVKQLQVKAVLTRPVARQGTPVVNRIAVKMELHE